MFFQGHQQIQGHHCHTKGQVGRHHQGDEDKSQGQKLQSQGHGAQHLHHCKYEDVRESWSYAKRALSSG